MAASTSRPRGRPRVSDETRKKNNVTIRMRDDLKTKVEQSAAGQRRSISEEIAARLDRSFDEQAAFGGPELQQTTYLMASAFAVSGQHSAGDADPRDWLRETGPYAAAMTGVIDAMLIGRADERMLINSLLGRLASRLARLEQDK